MSRKSLLAVAIEYEEGMEAPAVAVAGREERANEMLKTALRYGVPILERGPLAEELLRGGESSSIRSENYQAVADALVEACEPRRAPKTGEHLAPSALIPRTYLRK